MVQGPSILCGSLLTDPLWIAVKEERAEVLSAPMQRSISVRLNAFEFYTEVWARTFWSGLIGYRAAVVSPGEPFQNAT